jgi:hypothetical protein
MDRKEAMAWVVSVCSGLLRKSQVDTLSILVAATAAVGRLSLAEIGRELAAMQDQAAKYTIRRVWRFTKNPHIEPVEVMPVIMTRLLRRKLKWHGKRPDRRPLLVSLDWTKVRSFHVLMAGIVVDGRAVPLCWQSYKDKVQGKSQNALEEAMLLRIQAALQGTGVRGGEAVHMVILADRGFRRASLVEVCQRLKLDYLIRICDDVIVQTDRWRGNLKQYPIRRGDCRGFRDVRYRSDGVVQTNLILRWQKDLPPKKDGFGGPWYLITSLPLGRGRPRKLSDLYALRFDIEELFRDAKNEHLGWSLGKTRITRADRLDRLILMAALAYVLLVALGLWCREHLDPRLWCTNRRKRELSAFSIAKVMRQRTTPPPIDDLIRLLIASLATPEGKWG